MTCRGERKVENVLGSALANPLALAGDDGSDEGGVTLTGMTTVATATIMEALPQWPGAADGDDALHH